MKRLVATLGSVGWIKTLFSRHSILKAELPAATVVTGSPDSITVRWFSAVCTWTIRPRSGSSVSIFCAQAGTPSTARATQIVINLLISLFSFQLAFPNAWSKGPGGSGDQSLLGNVLNHNGTEPV